MFEWFESTSKINGFKNVSAQSFYDFIHAKWTNSKLTKPEEDDFENHLWENWKWIFHPVPTCFTVAKTTKDEEMGTEEQEEATISIRK